MTVTCDCLVVRVYSSLLLMQVYASACVGRLPGCLPEGVKVVTVARGGAVVPVVCLL